MRWGKQDVRQVLDAVVAVSAELEIDPSRLYAAGFSSGANFSYRMMAANPGMFRAIAPFSGRMQATRAELEHPAAAEGNTRVCIWHGTTDRTIRFKYARRAAQRLMKHGYEVRSHTLHQGHWFNVKTVPDIWQCMDGVRMSGES